MWNLVPYSRLEWRLLCALLLSCALLVGGCSKTGEASETDSSDVDSEVAKKKDGDKDGDDEEKKEEELPPVEVVSLERGPIEAVLRFSTNLEAESEVQVFSQAARLVTKLEVEEGDRVRKGQVLLRLQDEEQRSELARIESQLAKAKREFDRQKNLFNKALVSEQVMNDATYEVEQLELGLTDARRNLSYTEVRAPISGTITGRHVNYGDHITVNQHLFDLVDFDTIVARVYVPEKELGRLGNGQTARLFSDSIGSDARRGEVIRIAPIVDPKSGTVKATIGRLRTAEGERDRRLLPGMYVEVELVTDTRDDALLVPKRAVIYDQNQAYLYRLTDDMTAERLSIDVKLEDRMNILPATRGNEADLAVADRIVVAGQAGLKDGVKVRLAGQKAKQADEPKESEGEDQEAGEESEATAS